MTTEAYCAYCFESLAASLQKRVPLSLVAVERLWKLYKAEPEEDAAQDADMTDLESGDQEEELDEQTPTSAFRPAAINRLLAPSPSTASSSSIQSTISTPGISEPSSATSKSSSRTSFFSLGRKKNREENEQCVPATTEDYPLFVTWNIINSQGHKHLRGCIGTFEPQELDDGLRTYALTSAFDDTRFNPISIRELSSLECGVTLLTDFEPVSDALDWEIGKHGLRISFSYHGRRYGSTYLPDVAREQGWTKEETLISLMRKAGWSGKREDWRRVGDLTVIRYQGQRAELGYHEWREWRDWVEEQGGD